MVLYLRQDKQRRYNVMLRLVHVIFIPLGYPNRERVISIPHGHLHTMTYTGGRIDTIDSPDDEHLVARNM